MAVIGAGPAGSVCAYSALAMSTKIQVALVDGETFPRDKSCGDGVRCDAVSILRKLGLGTIFDGKPVIRQLEHTSPPGFKCPEISLTDGEVDPMDEIGYYIVERKIFDHHLYEAAITQGAKDYTGCRLTDAKFDESQKFWNLILQERSGARTAIRSRVLIGADGAGSRVRRIAGLSLNGQQHKAVGLRAYARTEDLAENIMRVDFTKSLIPGYGWVFPLGGGKVNIGVSLDARDYRSCGRSLVSYLDEYMGYLSGQDVAIQDLSGIKSHSLPLASMSPPLVPRRQLALIGDAAAMINPFTGEGIHYGIWAGHSLGTAIGKNVSQKKSVQAALEGYARSYAERFEETMKQYENLRKWLRFLRFLANPAEARS
ncbi:MAG: NAD(P)/FAD-dependent oxidoreductase [Gammaproteobacteria bacterium]|nr:NAD(P)/FAD-dependent oxidoreductase [Gammaproteobacteria bacterium]MDE0302507.1 NAD(P)/FAD-dependent oxidoreductase [Gammaproteobacteria bacterium]MDE0612702.1 NAD(P)/FAD-dependent oxidoreductase [Gammaproteobacteria bacterium]